MESASPSAEKKAPGVLKWFRVYCEVLVLVYLLAIVLGVFMLVRAGGDADESGEFVRSLQWVAAVALSVPLLVACGLPLFLKPRPWVWIYDLVIICLGTSSLLFLPFCIPLIIFWAKPESRAWFGRD